ncbi:MAG: type II toxin-antitoxin system VapC family toxin [Candidatus Eremiobacteraeota bacterium]|nr:type II toxin-antitoxin system VapC family toxin [Candidatus Eremiobacteraeota bacterium]MCW5869730.1 type II toxin-antitoxin system VapC family toxin [Candidatus Eremiobacteraeota bacterium]
MLPFDLEAAAVAAKIWSGSSRSQRQQLGDILIASVAISRHLPLVTRNKRDFERISLSMKVPLKLLDWTKAT